ncbi:MAG: cysteine synthase CysM [Fibrobacterales bacterium]
MHITELIGNTPLVELQRINTNPNVKVLVKLEGNNPAGSVKDRPAYSMIKRALERGEIDENSKLIEPTSGNTGIALAMVASMLGLTIELVMPANASKERVLTMEAFGATVTLTPAEGSMEGAIDYAHKQVKENGCVILNQFANPDNWVAHYEGTGPEIWNDTNGDVTHFVSSMGTTGTIMGVSRYLKEQSEQVQIVGCQPTENSNIPGIRRWPKEYLPKIFEPDRVDVVADVSEADAVRMTQRLAREEGIFAGMSSGGAVHVAVELAKTLESGTIVAIICDRGDRYLSTNLFVNKR